MLSCSKKQLFLWRAAAAWAPSMEMIQLRGTPSQRKKSLEVGGFRVKETFLEPRFTMGVPLLRVGQEVPLVSRKKIKTTTYCLFLNLFQITLLLH